MQPAVFQRKLYAWYAREKRDLPWRHTRDPYRIWISEVMLQQTQVERVKDYYRCFLERFPVVEDLAAAAWEDVLEQWRGLGYYRRARAIHRAAAVIVDQYAGKFPQSFEQLQKLPGIGRYTAAAICCFAFGQDIPAIDTNVSQIFAHVVGVGMWSTLKPMEQFAFVQRYIGQGEGALFHHALMDLASALRKGETCPFHQQCDTLPLIKKSSMKTSSKKKRQQRGGDLTKNQQESSIKSKPIKVAVGALIHNGKVLISKRRLTDSFPGKWEFPGGKLKPGEDARASLKREMKEEVDVEVSVRPPFHKVKTQYNGKDYAISFHRCSLLLGEAKPLQVMECRWVTAAELSDFDFPQANLEAIAILQSKKAMFRV